MPLLGYLSGETTLTSGLTTRSLTLLQLHCKNWQCQPSGVISGTTLQDLSKPLAYYNCRQQYRLLVLTQMWTSLDS